MRERIAGELINKAPIVGDLGVRHLPGKDRIGRAPIDGARIDRVLGRIRATAVASREVGQ